MADPLPPLDSWADSVADLEALQSKLGAATPRLWSPETEGLRTMAACFVCFPRSTGGRASLRQNAPNPIPAPPQRVGCAGDPGWAAAALFRDGRSAALVTVRGAAGAAYDPGHLAWREGPLLEAAVRALPEAPQVLLVNATGRDHPRRAGLAYHLGARLDVPSVGVTNRLLMAQGDWPDDRPGATSPFRLDGEIVGFWLRQRRGVRPLAVHAAWRTDPRGALAAVQACAHRRARTPEPLRAARRAAREARVRGSICCR